MQLSESVGCIQRMFAPNTVRGIPYAPALTERTFFHSVIRFHSSSFSFERAPGKPKPFGFSRSEKLRHRGGFGLPGALSKENGQGAIPLVGKKKMPCKHSGGKHTDSIARRRRAKRGLFGKSPLSIPQKLFGDCRRTLGVCAQSSAPACKPHRRCPRRKAAPGCRASALKAARQPISRTARCPAKR